MTATLSKEYRALLQKAHATQDWGGSGFKRAPYVLPFARQLGARSILDYGCGQGTLKTALLQATLGKEWRDHEGPIEFDIREYDPGIKGKDGEPYPADLVACTDVLEHIEPEFLDACISHMWGLARRGAFLLIATRLANKSLPDGRNAHLIVEPGPWWLERLAANGIEPFKVDDTGRDLLVWIARN